VLAERAGAPPASAGASGGGLFSFGKASSGGAAGTGGQSSGAGLFSFGDAGAAGGGGQSSGSSLFTFGVGGSSSGASNPFAASSSYSVFGAATTAKLFGGGENGGLFSDLGTEGSIFAPPSRTGGEAAKDGAAKAGAEGEKASGEAGENTGGGDEDRFVPQEEVTLVQGWTPSITLEVCGSIETGEEGEREIYSQRSKLYRFRDGEWKERGLGEARLLKNKSTGRVRFLLRQEKTGKIAANFFVINHKPYCDLRPNADSEKIWVWCAQDFSDGEANVEEFALKFSSVDLAGKFKEAFEDAKTQNGEVMAEELKTKESEDSKEQPSKTST